MSANRTAATFDVGDIDRAEEALQSLSVNFKQWMTEEVERMEAARADARAQIYSDASLQTLYLRAHDAKGLGTTYEYPMISAIAAQLCRLLGCEEGRQAAREQPSLVDAHVDAVRAILRADMRGAEHPVAIALLRELQARVNQWAKD
jgi:hypothetical protein